MVNLDDSSLLETEKDTEQNLFSLTKSNDLNENLNNNLRSTSSQPACLNGLAKILKKDKPLRPTKENLNKTLTKVFDNFE